MPREIAEAADEIPMRRREAFRAGRQTPLLVRQIIHSGSERPAPAGQVDAT